AAIDRKRDGGAALLAAALCVGGILLLVSEVCKHLPGIIGIELRPASADAAFLALGGAGRICPAVAVLLGQLLLGILLRFLGVRLCFLLLGNRLGAFDRLLGLLDRLLHGFLDRLFRRFLHGLLDRFLHRLFRDLLR